MASELLTVQEAAERLKLNPQTVRRWIRRGLLPGTKIGRKEWRIREGDLERCLGAGAPDLAERSAAVGRILSLRQRIAPRLKSREVDEIMAESRRELEARRA